MSDYIHIVCLDGPSPPDYGGAIDMYCKITSLHSTGKKIILHYFDYKANRGVKGLEAYCEEIYSYSRNSFLRSPFSPYIVSSRNNPKLIKRLNEDTYPVLLEGIHCTGIIPFLNPQKKVIVRIHNNEADYYKALYANESNFLKKLYFLYESRLLASYQKQLPEQLMYAFISAEDKMAFKEKYKQERQVFLPSFIPWQNVMSKPGNGQYCLYHGNLSVSENYKAAAWLIENVFSKLDFPLVIAGRSANKLRRFQQKVKIKLVNNPPDAELSSLIQNAAINVLPSMNSTGVKLKLLHALFEGRFCISNHNGIAGSGVENLVIRAESPADWIEAIQKTIALEFTAGMLTERNKILLIYNNQVNAQKLIELL